MDWGRAKSVLIISFLLLNVLLGYQLWADVQERLNTNLDLSELSPETARLMQQKNIEILVSIPTETPALKELTFAFASEAGSGQRVELQEPVDSKIVFSVKELRSRLGGIIPDLELYSFDQAGSSAFSFYRTEGRYPMFDATLELYYSNQKITAYKQNRVTNVQSAANDGDKAEQTLLPATAVIDKLVSGNNLQPGAVIKDIRLGYHGQTFGSEVPLAAPTWRVVLEDGKKYYMNAISGEVESASDGAQNGSPAEPGTTGSAGSTGAAGSAGAADTAGQQPG